MISYAKELKDIAFTQGNYLDEKSTILSPDNYESVMSDIYKFIKIETPKYYNGNEVDLSEMYLNGLIKKLVRIESNYGKGNHLLLVPTEFKLESKIDKLKKVLENNESIYNFTKQNMVNMDNNDEFLSYIIKEVRSFIIEKNFSVNQKNFKLEDIDLSNCCYSAAKYTDLICKKHNVKTKMLSIYPGFGKYGDLENDLLQHHANIIDLNGRYYLIDTTYSQFFYQYKNNLDRLGVIGMAGSYVGSYMMIDNNRLNVAKKLIKDGYIELTKNVLKMYMDGFALSFRNGLYYENNDLYSYITPYTDDDYIDFLCGNNSQIKEEGKENLGYQKRPLKNPKLDFKSFIK